MTVGHCELLAPLQFEDSQFEGPQLPFVAYLSTETTDPPISHFISLHALLIPPDFSLSLEMEDFLVSQGILSVPASAIKTKLAVNLN